VRPPARYLGVAVPRRLPQSFFARECLEVAAGLLGKVLKHGDVALRITEVEAYRQGGDSANHGRMGRTARNAAMWGPPGHAYVYLCYGLHQMLNLVTDRDGVAAAVLIRACEPVAGHAEVQRRRGGLSGPVSLAGPGKVGAALALDTTFSGHALFRAGGLELLDGPDVAKVLAGPRVGIDYAHPTHVAAPWRLALADSPWVSQRKTLAPVHDLRRFLREHALDDDTTAAEACE
jgi:DNA-3-methyladenine glycosylase